MTVQGLDYSAGVIPGATIKAAGYQFVIRYVDDPAAGLNAKHIRPGEYRDLVAAGVDVFLVFEVGTADMLAGHDAGVAHATRAKAGADWIGYPPDRPIFMACDMHLNPAQITSALAYIDGAVSVLGDACGVYGFWELVDACIAQGKGRWFWQCGISPDPTDAVHLWQRNDRTVTVGGISCDVNELRIPLTPSTGLDAVTLAEVMGNVPGVPYDQYLQPFIDGMIAAGCTTVKRAAMWFAQSGEESGGLQWMQELADGSDYEGRTDLGNILPGDGRLFKGRGPIQLTGRANYAAFSVWCHGKGLVPAPDYFVQNPMLVARPQWGFLAAAWFWTVARNINAAADAGDLEQATRDINGGLNGLDDRRNRYNRALAFGARLLPPEDDMTDADRAMLQDVHNALPAIAETHELLKWMWSQLAGENAEPFQFTGWPPFPGGSDPKKPLTVVDYLRTADVSLTDLKAEMAKLSPAKPTTP